MPKPRTFPIEVTLQQFVELRDVIKEAHAQQAWTAEKRLDEVEDGPKSWRYKDIESARAKQARMSDLHEAVTGEPLPPTPENDPKPVEVEEDA